MAQSKQLTRLEPWHHDLIDWWIANPRVSGREAAQHFDASPVWISIVKHSAIFQAEFQRRRERLSRTIEDDVRCGATALVEVSLDTMQERLDRDRDTIPLNQLVQMIKMAAKLLGLGGRNSMLPEPAPPVEFTIDPEVLAEARERARQVARMREAEEKPVKAG